MVASCLCNLHIWALRHIRRHISEDAAKTIVCSIIIIIIIIIKCFCYRSICRRLTRPAQDRRMSTGRSFQTDGAAWLKTRLAICVLTAGTLSRYCDEDHRFLVGTWSLTDGSWYAGLYLTVLYMTVSQPCS